MQVGVKCRITATLASPPNTDPSGRYPTTKVEEEVATCPSPQACMAPAKEQKWTSVREQKWTSVGRGARLYE